VPTLPSFLESIGGILTRSIQVLSVVRPSPLDAFEAESDPRLPPLYLRTDEVARAGRGLERGLPPRDAWLHELAARR
jgi:hypothetical protein